MHLSAELFSSMAGIKMVHVPFKGATEALTALLGGQLDLMFASLSSSIPMIKAGRLKAFAVTGAQRSPSIPELPTMAEAALPGYAAAAWYGIVGPAGIPQPIVAVLNNTALAALNTQEVKDRLFASGVEVRTSTPEEFARLIESEMRKWAKVVKDSGAKVGLTKRPGLRWKMTSASVLLIHIFQPSHLQMPRPMIHSSKSSAARNGTLP